MTCRTPWTHEGWRGWLDAGAAADVPACLALAVAEGGRRSRHARTARLDRAAGALFVKTYAAPGGWRALRAHRMGEALRAAGFAAPETVLVARRGGEGLLVTRDVGGDELSAAVAALGGAGGWRARRTVLRALGTVVGRLHARGFVHGDLVPANVRVCGRELVLLDHDRTRHARLLVWFGGRRNLVQLGRFVVPGVTATDRARVLAAYAAARGLSRGARRRLGRWVVRKTIARRCAIDRIPEETARRAGFRLLMRSGGPFDPARWPGRAA